MRLQDALKTMLTGGLLLLALPAFPAAHPEKKAAIASRAFHYFVAKEPSWVRHLEVPQQPSAVVGNPAYRILLQDDQKQYADKGATLYSHRAMLPLQKSALDKVSQIEIEFSPEYQTLTLHQVSIVRDGVRIDRLDRSKVRLIQREKDLEKQMYNGVVTASLVLDDVRVGDVVDYSYSIGGSNPVFGDRIDAGYPLGGWDVPVERLNIRLLTPVGRKFSVRLHNLQLEPATVEQNGVRETVWSRSQIAASLDEDEYPSWYIPFAWLEISDYEDWSQVMAWARPMYRFSGELSPALLRQIEQWKTTSGSQRQAALKALNFVQQEIRYFGVEIGTSSHLPSHPNQVFKQRYGDCKDKSLLLSTILGRMGIKAYPALVSARFARGIESFMPTAHAFDHVITKAEIDGKTWWLDATNNFQSGDFENRGYGDFGRALVIGDDSRGLTAMRVPDNGQQRIEEVYSVADFDKPVKLVVTQRADGVEANQMRFLIGNYGEARMADYRLNLYAKIYQGIRRDGQPVLDDDHEQNRYTVTDSYVIDGFFQRGSGRWKAEMYNIALRNYLEFPKVIKRKSPFGLNVATHLRYRGTLKFENPNSSTNNESVLVGDDYLQFWSSLSHAAKEARLVQELDFLQDSVPAERIAEYVDRQTQIRRRLGYTLSFADRSTMVWSDNPARQSFLHAVNSGDLAAVERHLNGGMPANTAGVADISALLVAVMDNRVDAVRLLIGKGADVNAAAKGGLSPLRMAVLNDSEQIVGELLRAGANVDAAVNGQTALMLAAEKGSDGIVKLLLAKGAEVDRRNPQHYNHTALMYAALNGHADSVRALLAGHANRKLTDVKEFTPLLLAAESGDWETLAALLEAGADPREVSGRQGLGAMTMLVRSNNSDAVAAGIKYGLDLDVVSCNGFTPLMYALKNGNRRIVRLLEEHGAHYRETGKDGYTPLMSAIEHQDSEQAKRLIEQGADVRATNRYGVSALTLASAFGMTDIAAELINKGADVNQVDKGWRETPLMYATENGSKKMVELLVNNGADPNQKDVDGDSILARTYPVEKGELYDMLLAAGAKREFVHSTHKQ